MSSTPAAGKSTASKSRWLCKAPATYNKQQGTLFLNATNLVWKQDGVPQPALNIKTEKAWSLFNSKEGTIPIRMKVALVDNEKGHFFAFTAPPEEATKQRGDFIKELTQIINKNKSRSAAGTPQPGTPGTPGDSGSPSASGGAATPAAGASHQNQQNLLRMQVLMKHPELAELHRELVRTGQITEHEFWQGREWMLSAEEAAQGQKRGRPSQLVDPKPTTAEGGDIKIVITPQLVHDIFDEFPIVAQAYADNVPKEMDEAAFWSRYFQSKLFNQNRASTRSAAPQHVVKDDPIFDKYLEPEDDQIEPRHVMHDSVDRLLDLTMTEEDHDETGNEKDVTMQAGRERGILPLIRRFNTHSERLLQTSLGEDGSKKTKSVRFDPDYYYSQIDLEDLHAPESSSGQLLPLADSQKFFDSSTRRGPGADIVMRSEEESEALIEEFKSETTNWKTTLENVKLNKRSADTAFGSMTATIKTKHDARHHQRDIPPDFLRQLTTCQTAANEFLRQFWSAVLPPPADVPRLAQLTPHQRSTKAAKMAGYLSKTGEKVDALVQAAPAEGVDPARVEAAFTPLMCAVNKALKVSQTRRS